MTSKETDVARIRNYLLKQNRPYSLNDLFLNLHKEIGKTAAQKSLDQLVADGYVREKVYGKQKVYVTDQSQFPTVNENELKQLEKDVAVLSENVAAKLKEVQLAETAIKTVLTSLTTKEMLQDMQKVELENNHLAARLAPLQQQQTVMVTNEERKRVTAQRTAAMAEWRRRRRLARDVLDAILESYPDTKQQLYQEIGVETDEEAGVKMPP